MTCKRCSEKATETLCAKCRQWVTTVLVRQYAPKETEK